MLPRGDDAKLPQAQRHQSGCCPRDGAAKLAGALQQSPSVKELHVKGNELGDAGLEALCEALLVRSADLAVGSRWPCCSGCAGLSRSLIPL